MSANASHKLQQLELPPPPGNWEKIARRLDREFRPDEISLAQQLQTASLEVPAAAWKSISLQLDAAEEEPSPTTAPRISIKRTWLVAAAILLLTVSGIALYWANTSPATSATSGELVKKADPPPPASGTTPDEPQQVLAIQTTTAPHKPTQRPKRLRGFQFIPAALAGVQGASAAAEAYTNPSALPASHILLADATTEVAVNAPLIRDETGKVIMDMSLLTTQPGNYITITGPNGEQTRISTKFANFLASLNNNPGENNEYIDYLILQSESWKKRFDEWRSKIMERASFAPSGGTFFDILELKELIKD